MIQNSKLLLILAFVIIALSACYNPQIAEENKSPSYKYNFSSIYNPAETNLHPEVRIFINDTDEALVFFRLNYDELKASRQSQMDTSVSIMVKYALRDVESFAIVDTGVNVFNFKFEQGKKSVSSYFKVNPKKNTNNKLIVSFANPRSDYGARIIVDVDNEDTFGKDKFLLEKFESVFMVKFYNFVKSDEVYRLRSNAFDRSKLIVNYHNFDEYVVIPPYFTAETEESLAEPDSIFTYTVGDSVSFNEEGFYIFKASENKDGLICLINTGVSYPNIDVLSDMLEPLNLLATNKQIREINESENLKVAIDQFWLEKSNNQKFAREQIRVFYNRVKLANKYFSDYREGWKTDRGILYVVLGPPTIVNMSSKGEEWFYGENPDVAGVLFVFDKGRSITGSTIYRLRRDAIYQTIWSQAIATWRDGRIFTITKN